LREGVVQLEPINDFIYLALQPVGSIPLVADALRDSRAGSSDAAAVNPRGVAATLRTYGAEYLSAKPKVFKPDSGNLLVDPWPCIRFACHAIYHEIAIRLGRLARASHA
jgi:hypothetical protein